ncbi:hypothetical protein RJ639_026681, partial [Escallonia herrerae]
VDVSQNRKDVVIHHVILFATRRTVRPPKKGSAAQRPRSWMLTTVHDPMLEDIVVPAERVRYRIDGSKMIKVSYTRHGEDHNKYSSSGSAKI